MGSEVSDAKDFVQEHMNNYTTDKILIYGYSMGGVRANELAEELIGSYNVSAEFTVDAYSFPKNYGGYYGQEIPENVKTNYNLYQEKASSVTGARGGINWSKGNNTNILNFKIKKSSHSKIDEETNDFVFKFMIFHLYSEN